LHPAEDEKILNALAEPAGLVDDGALPDQE
jgi:hypothetical protein